jgi:CRISPR-associated endonuclease/helicase Cas3
LTNTETQLRGIHKEPQKFAAESARLPKCHFGKRELVLCSATLDATILKEYKLNYQSIALGESDRADNSSAARKINFLKRLHRLPISQENYRYLIAQTVAAEHISDTLSLCIVNKVDDAIGIVDCLGNSDIPVKLLHSRFRGYERDQLGDDLANFKGVVISTQVIEAGIDLDARKLFTMPCPWASFVQRCGRAGRNGTYSDCDVYLLDVQGLNFKPYEDTELRDFWRCFNKLSDVNIATLLNINPPKQHIPGTAQVLTIGFLEGLFDSHPKPDSSCDDVNGYIRGEIDASVSVMWREFEEEPERNWGYQQEELCRITAKRFYKFYSNPVWVWNNSQDLWELKDKPTANQIVLLPRSAGGYSDRLGFTGDISHLPSNVPIALLRKSNKKFSDRKINPVTLKQHSTDARRELLKIKSNLEHLDLCEFWTLAADCSQWHDLGKAHPQFQDAIFNPTEIGAKAPSMKQYQSKGFRHELASAIGALMHGKDFLFAYIVAAHHGKIRVRVDNFFWLKDEKGLRGLMVGDKVRSCSLGNDVSGNEVKIDEFLIDLPDSGEWKQSVEREIENLGVFKLSYLETLVRIADRRASALREI